MLLGFVIVLIAVLLFSYTCFDTEEHESPSADHGSIISFIYSKHKTPNPLKSYCGQRAFVRRIWQLFSSF